MTEYMPEQLAAPTTGDIRWWWVEGRGKDVTEADAIDQFNRWLADRDRENRAIGWDEGFDKGHYYPNEDPTCDCKANPYRGDNR